MPLRLVYISTLSAGVGRNEVDRIVAHSAEANDRRGITGLLALDEDRVCQVLEGPGQEIEKLFETIRGDRRHRDVVMLDCREVDTPHFGRWGMARRRMVDIVTLALTI